jgi:hypothetical protein
MNPGTALQAGGTGITRAARIREMTGMIGEGVAIGTGAGTVIEGETALRIQRLRMRQLSCLRGLITMEGERRMIRWRRSWRVCSTNCLPRVSSSLFDYALPFPFFSLLD